MVTSAQRVILGLSLLCGILLPLKHAWADEPTSEQLVNDYKPFVAVYRCQRFSLLEGSDLGCEPGRWYLGTLFSAAQVSKTITLQARNEELEVNARIDAGYIDRMEGVHAREREQSGAAAISREKALLDDNARLRDRLNGPLRRIEPVLCVLAGALIVAIPVSVVAGASSK